LIISDDILEFLKVRARPKSADEELKEEYYLEDDDF
jgi:hypothetical protein